MKILSPQMITACHCIHVETGGSLKTSLKENNFHRCFADVSIDSHLEDFSPEDD